ncbi:MAG: hypothetical protein ABI690_13435 [Chloroflexota bacterium]
MATTDEFKPPWNFFPLHTTRVWPFSVVLEVGFDQGNQMCFTVCMYGESGEVAIGGPGGESWKELIPAYLEQIAHARWLAAIETQTNIPRYMRLNDESRSWEGEYYRRKFTGYHEQIAPACVMCGKRTVALIDDICADCHMEIFWQSVLEADRHEQR